ncbi:MAG: EamA family transporter [Thermodesulfobacteriota bacterium]
MLKIPYMPICFMLLTALFSAIGQIFFKYGSDYVGSSIFSWIFNYYLIIGLMIHAVGFYFMISAFKQANLSLIYPVLATSYIWVAIFSSILLKEKIQFIQWFGMMAIVAGIFMILKK